LVQPNEKIVRNYVFSLSKNSTLKTYHLKSLAVISASCNHSQSTSGIDQPVGISSFLIKRACPPLVGGIIGEVGSSKDHERYLASHKCKMTIC
jgi:hypothetical protein